MSVHDSIQHLEPKLILNTRPPEITKSESIFLDHTDLTYPNYALITAQDPPAPTAPCLMIPPPTSSTALPTQQPSLPSTSGNILPVSQNSLQITLLSPTSPLSQLFLMTL